MSLAVLHSRALVGMHAPPVTVEVHLANGLPAFTIVGLPETEVKESKDRVRAALLNARFEFPSRRITVNLAPADLPKESGRYDLPIALGILAASGQVPAQHLHKYEFAGELSLSGELRPIRGALAMTYALLNAQENKTYILPRQSAAEAALVQGVNIIAADDLNQVVMHLSGQAVLPIFSAPAALTQVQHQHDLIDIKGQKAAKRALEIAAAGGHSVLMLGPPGSGKTALAQRLPSILPPMTDAEAMGSAAVLSLANAFKPSQWAQRPFRAPHHTASGVALVGGGGNPRPGEISLAHHGVLFLDELPEFDKRVLEVLREPLESGRITISRAARQADFPARFQLIAAMNPCPCGYLGHVSKPCRCMPDAVLRYQGRISGPLLDRIDVQIEVPALPQEELTAPANGEPSAKVAARVAQARERALQRQGKPNALLELKEIETVCEMEADAQALLHAALARMGLSARAYHRVLKVARSVADLDGTNKIARHHIAQAVQYRRALAVQ
jgi:magnesium chelatase family protein